MTLLEVINQRRRDAEAAAARADVDKENQDRLRMLWGEARSGSRTAMASLAVDPQFALIAEQYPDPMDFLDLVASKLGIAGSTSEVQSILRSIEDAVRRGDKADPYANLSSSELR